jgi:hypothetical protein
MIDNSISSVITLCASQGIWAVPEADSGDGGPGGEVRQALDPVPEVPGTSMFKAVFRVLLVIEW